MLKENTRVQNAAAELRKVFAAEAPDAAAVETAFEEFGNAIASAVQADYESAHGDQNILLQRGFRVLTAEEKDFYQSIIKAGKEKTVQTMNGLLDNKVMPVTIIEDVYKDLVQEHPLLSEINFQSVAYLTRWILNDHSVQTAVWGPVNSQITQQIASAFRVVELAQNKLSAYAVIEMDMLDLGPTFLDGYIRAFLKESVFVGCETAIVTGNGLNSPIGLDRDIHQGVSVNQSTGYPQKTAVEVTDFTPVNYGELLANLAETEVWYTNDSNGNVVAASTALTSGGALKSGYTKHGGNPRSFDEVLLICNQKEFLRKIMPASTAINADGTYKTNIFPFPTKVVKSNAVENNRAIVCLPKEYFFGIGTSKDGTITYTDDLRFLEDQRVFKVKMHGAGKAFDDTCALLLDISNLEPFYIWTKNIINNINTGTES